MRSRRSVARPSPFLLVVLVLFAPVAVADVTLDAPGASVTLGTGHDEDCVPSPDACVLAADRAGPVGDWTVFVNADASLAVHATPHDAAPGGVAPGDAPSARVSVREVTVGLPVHEWVAVAWDRVIPDDPVFGSLVHVDSTGVLLAYPWVYGVYGSHEPAPRVSASSEHVPWPYANRSGVTVAPPALREESSDEFGTTVAHVAACEYGFTALAQDPDACRTSRFGADARDAWATLTPAIVTGLHARGADVVVENASRPRGHASAAAALGDALEARAPHATLASGSGLDRPGASTPPLAPAPGDVTSRLDVARSNEDGAVATATLRDDVRADAPRALAVASAATVGAGVLLALALLYRHRVRGESAQVLLRNGTRQALVTAVRERPGRKASEIARAVGVSHNNALYHLRLLEQARVVRFVRHGGPRSHVHVFPHEDAPARDRERQALLLQADAARALARVLARAGDRGVTSFDLHAATGLPVSAIRFHLRRFEDAFLVHAAPASGQHLVFVMPEEERAFVRCVLTPRPRDREPRQSRLPSGRAERDGVAV